MNDRNNQRNREGWRSQDHDDRMQGGYRDRGQYGQDRYQEGRGNYSDDDRYDREQGGMYGDSRWRGQYGREDRGNMGGRYEEDYDSSNQGWYGDRSGRGGMSGYDDRYGQDRYRQGRYSQGERDWGYGNQGQGGYNDRWGRGNQGNWGQGNYDDMGGRSSQEGWQGMNRSGEYARGENQMRGEHYGKGPKGYQRSDERIREDVSEKLYEAHEVDASEIEVQVKNGEVTLSGTVSDRQQKRRAEEIVEQCTGVKDVQNQIRVQQSGTRNQGNQTEQNGQGMRQNSSEKGNRSRSQTQH